MRDGREKNEMESTGMVPRDDRYGYEWRGLGLRMCYRVKGRCEARDVAHIRHGREGTLVIGHRDALAGPLGKVRSAVRCPLFKATTTVLVCPSRPHLAFKSSPKVIALCIILSCPIPKLIPHLLIYSSLCEGWIERNALGRWSRVLDLALDPATSRRRCFSRRNPTGWDERMERTTQVLNP